MDLKIINIYLDHNKTHITVTADYRTFLFNTGDLLCHSILTAILNTTLINGMLIDDRTSI